MLWCHRAQSLAERKVLEKTKPFERPVIITDLNEQIIAVNAYWVDMCKFSAEDAFGSTPKLLQGPLTNTNSALLFAFAIRSGEPTTASIINYKKNGEFFINRLIGWQLGDILIAETYAEDSVDSVDSLG